MTTARTMVLSAVLGTMPALPLAVVATQTASGTGVEVDAGLAGAAAQENGEERTQEAGERPSEEGKVPERGLPGV